MESCYPNSNFTDPAIDPNLASDLGALAAHARPNDVTCALTSSGFRDLDQVLLILHPKNASPSAVLHVWTVEKQLITYEAPLDGGLADMLEEICNEVVERRATCVHTGHDGVWYLLEAPGGARAAVTWSPKPGTKADSVIDTFVALRAYVTSPVALRFPALQTSYRETYVMHSLLGPY